jgi:dienelactone hydrolase
LNPPFHPITMAWLPSCRAAVMWIMQETLRPAVLGRSLSGIVLAAALLAANGAASDIIKKQDLLRGITAAHAQCEETSQKLWLSVHGRDFCIRYYLSTAGGEGPRPVVFLAGDQLGKLNTKTWTWIDTSEAKDIDTDNIMELADAFSKMAKTTAIYLARIGVDGTSGNHTARKTVLELDLMNAALDAIKRRHGFEGFHLAGQSGGSKIAGGLIGLRRDISCAVLGSGPLVLAVNPKSTDPGRSYFDPAQNIPQVAQNRSMRLFLITDKADKRVPVAQQTGFIDRLRRAGRKVPQFFVEAIDDNHHGVTVYAELVTAGCVLDRSDEEIARAVNTIVKRNTEYNERRRKEINAKASIEAAARQALLDSGAAPGGN